MSPGGMPRRGTMKRQRIWFLAVPNGVMWAATIVGAIGGVHPIELLLFALASLVGSAGVLAAYWAYWHGLYERLSQQSETTSRDCGRCRTQRLQPDNADRIAWPGRSQPRVLPALRTIPVG